MKTLNFLAAAVLTASLTGCQMSDREYQLRKAQLEAQSKHPPTYDVLSVAGPVKIEILDGGTARVTAPNQPFREIPIPDGVRTQAELVTHLINIGAVTVLGAKALDKSGGGRKTVINNAAGE